MKISLGPLNLGAGVSYLWSFKISGPDEPQRVTLRVWARRFRQASAATHSHTALSSGGSDTTVGAHQSLVGGDGTDTTLQVAVDTAGQASVTVPTSADSAGTPSGTISAEGATAGAALDAAPNANLDITIDGRSWKTGLGDGTEKLLFEEDVTSLLRGVGEHSIEFACGANGAIQAELEVL